MRAIVALLLIDVGLVFGFIMPSVISVDATNALIITFLPVVILFAWIILSYKLRNRSFIQRLMSVIVLSSLPFFFLGLGTICGMFRNENMIGEHTTTGGEGDILIFLARIFNINVTGTHLFILFMTASLTFTLWSLKGILMPSIWELKRKAVDLEKKGRLEEAKQIYWKAISKGFPYVHPYERLRIIYAKQGDLKGAVRACEAYVDTSGDNAEKERMKEWIRKYQAKLRTGS